MKARPLIRRLKRLFHRHDWRDAVTGWPMPHYIIPTVEGGAVQRKYICRKCGARRYRRKR